MIRAHVYTGSTTMLQDRFGENIVRTWNALLNVSVKRVTVKRRMMGKNLVEEKKMWVQRKNTKGVEMLGLIYSMYQLKCRPENIKTRQGCRTGEELRAERVDIGLVLRAARKGEVGQNHTCGKVVIDS